MLTFRNRNWLSAQKRFSHSSQRCETGSGFFVQRGGNTGKKFYSDYISITKTFLFFFFFLIFSFFLHLFCLPCPSLHPNFSLLFVSFILHTLILSLSFFASCLILSLMSSNHLPFFFLSSSLSYFSVCPYIFSSIHCFILQFFFVLFPLSLFIFLCSCFINVEASWFFL